MVDETLIELKNIVEAMLFASPKPLSINELKRVAVDYSRDDIKTIISSLREEYNGRGVHLVAVAGGYRFFSREDYAKYVLEVIPKETEQKLSRAALETLSIVAYKQPLTRVSVEDIRGVASSGVIGTLVDRGLIEVKGRLEVAGRPKVYGTTRRFLTYFGLNSIEELPPLKESITGREDESEPDSVDVPEIETGNTEPLDGKNEDVVGEN